MLQYYCKIVTTITLEQLYSHFDRLLKSGTPFLFRTVGLPFTEYASYGYPLFQLVRHDVPVSMPFDDHNRIGEQWKIV